MTLRQACFLPMVACQGLIGCVMLLWVPFLAFGAWMERYHSPWSRSLDGVMEVAFDDIIKDWKRYGD